LLLGALALAAVSTPAPAQEAKDKPEAEAGSRRPRFRAGQGGRAVGAARHGKIDGKSRCDSFRRRSPHAIRA
jgi:hypothetical protein